MKKPEPKPAAMQGGFVRMMRTPETMELVCHEPNAFRLATIIAMRCRWREEFNVHGLRQGEAMLGDYRNYGMTEKEYRVAKLKLAELGFAEFRRAKKGRMRGTIGRLVNTALFDTSEPTKGGARAEQGRQTKKVGRREKITKTALRAFREPSDDPFPATPEQVYAFADEVGATREMADRFIHVNNGNGWPCDSWQAAFLGFVKACNFSGASPVPKRWKPEIIVPESALL